MIENQKDEITEARLQAQNLYQPELRRALVIMQSTFMNVVVNHTRLLGYKNRGIAKPARVDAKTAEAYLDQNQSGVVPRSDLTEFLSTLLLRTSFDTILTEEYFQEFILPLVSSTDSVQDFLLDLQAQFYAYWTPSDAEVLQIATMIVQGFKPHEPYQDVVWVLPETIYRRLPNYEYWLDKIRHNRFLLMILILHLCSISRDFIEDLE